MASSPPHSPISSLTSSLSSPPDPPYPSAPTTLGFFYTLNLARRLPPASGPLHWLFLRSGIFSPGSLCLLILLWRLCHLLSETVPGHPIKFVLTLQNLLPLPCFSFSKHLPSSDILYLHIYYWGVCFFVSGLECQLHENLRIFTCLAHCYVLASTILVRVCMHACVLSDFSLA